ncbi:MAG TPA: DUF1343 domain-containing protein [Opitutales bacterium]|nr:DUF1343 domain-containing protein [Opitutales bacterium]
MASLLSVTASFSADAVETGAEKLAAEEFRTLGTMRVGLITNHTATVGDRHLADAIHEAKGPKLTALFGPEHGIRGDAPAGAKVDDAVDPQTQTPVYSLYGPLKKPTQEMLENVDILLFDIQDVGARFYTYISTMGYGMQAAAEKGIPFMVLDRPNPLGGELVEGFVLEEEVKSFVGLYPIPIVHGLTVGELARMIQGEKMIDGVEELDLRIVELGGWERNIRWDDLDRNWNPPSPNLPDFETAAIYPGTCFFEGTSGSEGRGTYEPFRVIGAPWIDSEKFVGELNEAGLSGLRFEQTTFVPKEIPKMAARPKHQDTRTHGVRIFITDSKEVQPVATGIHLLTAFMKQAPEGEIVLREGFLANLAGTKRLAQMLRDEIGPDEIIASWKDDIEEFKKRREPYLLY